MPSLQSKLIVVLLHVMRMKRTVNRMRQRVESGERTYTEPSPRLQRMHRVTKREVDGHLALAQHLHEGGLPQPGNVVLLSPWLDATLSNPEIAAVDKIDPFMGVEGLKYAGAEYTRNVDPKSYLASPVYGSCRDLAPVTVFIGTRDVFLPDCRKLRERAAAEGVEIDYREYEGMVHDWMLGPLPEAKQVLNEIVAMLG